MGTVISFPAAARVGREPRPVAVKSETATVIILPVIRIERLSDGETKGSQPQASSGGRRRRKRRANRS